MDNRIYVVIDKKTEERRLIKATTPAQAIRHVVRNAYEAAVPNTTLLADLMGGGLRVESAIETETKTDKT